ncbi:MAG: PLDc N-terminal domain-containing protein [Bacteroidetes bacterium]|nr:PLDc N-terminal domain-containing protein [Bacteroidota bacterium]
MYSVLSFFPHYFYYISIALQAICVIHCLRRGGNTQKWIWLIVFLPVIGSLAYLFTEIIHIRDLSGFQAGLGSLVNPAGRIKRLESNLKFSDTFNNRVMLADAYMLVGRVDEAIELYESSLTGAFTENEHVIKQLIAAYFQKGRYAEVLPLARKIYNRPQFSRSKEHIFYARALELTGDAAGAEREFIKMKSRFSNFEARYQYGLFLQRAGRENEARAVFEDIAGEASHLSSRERRDNHHWIAKAKEELR